MRAIVLEQPGTMALVEKPAPRPAADEILIAPLACGICGTDLHLAAGDYPEGKLPVVPGHEFAGIVAEAGAEVRGVGEGDLVAVDPNIACGRCRWCKIGAPNLCERLLSVGVSTDGACAELVAVPARLAYKLPPALDAATGALVEPLACVVHGFGRIDSVSDRNVLVYGAGSIGLLAIFLASRLGAAQILAVEPVAARREMAVEFGAHAAYSPDEEMEREGIDIVIEASGAPRAVADGLRRLGKRGVLLQMGVAPHDAAIPFSPFALFDNEITIVGSRSLATSFPEAVELVPELSRLSGRLVTHTFPLARYAEALETAASPTALKVQVLPQS